MIGTHGWKNCYDPEYLGKSHRVPGQIYGISTEDNYYINLDNEQDFLTAYNICPPLKAILGKRAKAFNTGVRQVINPDSGKPAQGNMAKMLRDLIAKPNILQNGSQFFAQQNHYIDLFGYCPVFVLPTPGMELIDISSIWNIPPWLFDIKYTNKWLQQTTRDGIYKSFFMTWDGKQIELDFKSLHFIYDDGFGTEYDCNLTIPDSRLKGLEYCVSNIAATYKTRNTLITKRGAVGILSNDGKDGIGAALPIDKKDKENLQNEFSKYGLTGQPYQIIITDAALKWQQMGFPTKDLLLFEEIQDDIERICDGFGWPIELIARGRDVTYDNKIQARKDLYQNTIIPESESRMQQFTTAVVPKDEKIIIIEDFSHIAILQDDVKTRAEGIEKMNQALKIEYDNGLITKNDWLLALGKEQINRPEFNTYKDETPPEDTSVEATVEAV